MTLLPPRGSTGPRIDTTRRLARVLGTDIAAAVLLVLLLHVTGVC